METVSVRVAVEEFADCHLRLEYRVWPPTVGGGKDKDKHSHSSQPLQGPPRLVGFSFLKLMEADGTAVRDGSHVLLVSKKILQMLIRD